MIKSTLVTSWTFLTLWRVSLHIWTRLSLIHQWMIILLFPSMTMLAASHILATISILCNKSSSSPILAKMFVIILKDIRFSSKILPIMTIHALRFVVIFVKWTKLSFIVIHIEICIFCHLVDDTLL